MAQLLKKENITVIIGTYQKDGQEKKKYRTIGELLTMQGDDGGVYQFGEIWGPHGVTSFNVYQQDDNKSSQPQQQGYQQPQQQYASGNQQFTPPQQNYQHPPQQSQGQNRNDPPF